MIWDFLQRYDDSWIWRCADRHEITESSRNFAALDECVADAVLHGYSDTRTGRARKSAKGSAARKPVARKRTVRRV